MLYDIGNRKVGQALEASQVLHTSNAIHPARKQNALLLIAMLPLPITRCGM
jgi:hypothetical protein